MGALLRKLWKGTIIAINALGLFQFCKWIEKLLGLGEHVEFIAHLSRDMGEAGRVLEFLLDPPPALGLAIVVLGLGLIWWEVRRRHQSFAEMRASNNARQSPGGAQMQIESFMGGGLPKRFPKEGRIYRLAVSYYSGWGGAAEPRGFNERYGPPGSTCGVWNSEFNVGQVCRCEITNYGGSPIFNVSMNFRIELREVVETRRLTQAGRIMYAHDRNVDIPKLERGRNNRFVFYAHNESGLFAFIGIPSVASYMALGETATRERPLLPPSMTILSFPPSDKIVHPPS